MYFINCVKAFLTRDTLWVLCLFSSCLLFIAGVAFGDFVSSGVHVFLFYAVRTFLLG